MIARTDARPADETGVLRLGNATGLTCRECGNSVPLGPFYACDQCFGPLEVGYDFPRLTRADIEAGPQNMWRYAGDLEKAGVAAKRWSDAEPSDPNGPDRAGEIAYLQGNFATAASDFADAAARAQGEQVATEQLKRGRETDSKENWWWSNQLHDAYWFGEDFGTVTDLSPVLARVTSDNIKASAKRFFDEKNQVFYVLRPTVAAAPVAPATPGKQ